MKRKANAASLNNRVVKYTKIRKIEIPSLFNVNGKNFLGEDSFGGVRYQVFGKPLMASTEIFGLLFDQYTFRNNKDFNLICLYNITHVSKKYFMEKFQVSKFIKKGMEGKNVFHVRLKDIGISIRGNSKNYFVSFKLIYEYCERPILKIRQSADFFGTAEVNGQKFPLKS